jgi:hypothetical protein
MSVCVGSPTEAAFLDGVDLTTGRWSLLPRPLVSHLLADVPSAIDFGMRLRFLSGPAGVDPEASAAALLASIEGESMV